MVHIGNNVERIRTAKGIRQQTMADGLNVTQQRWSQLIKEEQWAPRSLQKVSEIYGMTPEEIQNYDEEKSIVSKGDHNHFTIYIVNLNINGADDKSIDKVGDLITRLKNLNDSSLDPKS